MLTRAALIGACGVGLLMLALTGLASAVGANLSSREIAFVSYISTNPDIFLTDLGRGLTHNLTQHDAYDGAPAWSPDGEWLAFQTTRNGQMKIYVMRNNRRDLRLLTAQPGGFTAPSWSSDGERVYFFAANQNNSMFSIRRDGTDLRQITQNGVVMSGQVLDLAFDPAAVRSRTSPDGRWTTFMRYEDYEWGIYVASSGDQVVSRRESRLLSPVGRAYLELPVWSPDGSAVAFSAYSERISGGGVFDLFTVSVNADGSSGVRQQITFTPQLDSAPTWRP